MNQVVLTVRRLSASSGTCQVDLNAVDSSVTSVLYSNTSVCAKGSPFLVEVSDTVVNGAHGRSPVNECTKVKVNTADRKTSGL